MTLLPGPGTPTPPIPLAGGNADGSGITARLATEVVPVDEAILSSLSGACTELLTADDVRAEASRDWWPLAMTWATQGQVPQLPAAVARAASVEEVAAVLRICNEERVPVTTAAGRSGVCGGSAPVFGGVVLDLTPMSGIVGVDREDLVCEALPGTFGDLFEETLQGEHGLTAGHWPQSMALSTVGGWVACRGAGQYSTRYGKIEDIVAGLDVVLADGTLLRAGGAPRAAVGPDLTQLFVGSEGTLGVITSVRLKVHPLPPAQARRAYGFASFGEGLQACRRILQRGATPAVLRLYDSVEADRTYGTGSDLALLLVLDEAEHAFLDAVIAVVDAECATAAQLDVDLVDHWLAHRNDVSALEAFISQGFVVDTMEIAGRWSNLEGIYAATIEAIGSIEGIAAVSAHQSHAYRDGACLYFTFGGLPSDGDRDRFYRQVWDAGTAAVLSHGGALSHHHGVGLNRGRFMAEALGSAFDTLTALKSTLDPHGILNPGKLGLPSPFGEVPWP